MRPLHCRVVLQSLLAASLVATPFARLRAQGVRFVAVEPDVQLEVLDWGGTGRPLVLLTGLGNNAHVFDSFARSLTGDYHVYGITRRGFGESSWPLAVAAYHADRLGDDVLAVIDSLHLDRPVLAGHSIAGQELSSVGSRHPEKVAGLIYLDAGYRYAFYDSTGGVPELPGAIATSTEADIELKIMAGAQRYTGIRGPVLAIYAAPHTTPVNLLNNAADFAAADSARVVAVSKGFKRVVPTAQLVYLPHANHYVFESNAPEVLREMRVFIDGLPR